jgi:hypothetical protein
MPPHTYPPSTRPPRRSAVRDACLALSVALLAACASPPPPRPPPPRVIAPPPPATDFRIAADALDTWNAAGQILVRTDGVVYEGRAQMLGLYDVAYRGDRFLVLMRPVYATDKGQGASTKVSVALANGKPDTSVAAIALLAVLQARLPDEIVLDASGARGRKHCLGRKKEQCN